MTMLAKRYPQYAERIHRPASEGGYPVQVTRKGLVYWWKLSLNVNLSARIVLAYLFTVSFVPGRFREGGAGGGQDTPDPSLTQRMPSTELFENPNMGRVANYLLIVIKGCYFSLFRRRSNL